MHQYMSAARNYQPELIQAEGNADGIIPGGIKA
jgi:hypothetical protein